MAVGEEVWIIYNETGGNEEIISVHTSYEGACRGLAEWAQENVSNEVGAEMGESQIRRICEDTGTYARILSYLLKG